MDNLVKRLRNSDDLNDQQFTFACMEAADEIERLRVALTEAEKAALIGDAPHVAVICRRALKEQP